jgi:hypothetical protein
MWAKIQQILFFQYDMDFFKKPLFSIFKKIKKRILQKKTPI